MGSHKRVFDLVGQSDSLINDFSISDHINWSLVSRDFNRYIAKSEHYWYLFLKKYHKSDTYDKFSPLVKNPNTNGWVGVDYYDRMKGLYYGKFKKVFQVEMILPLEVKYPTHLYTKNEQKITSKVFSWFEIQASHGLSILLANLSCVYLRNVNDRDEFKYYNEINDQLLNSHEENFHDLVRVNLPKLEIKLYRGEKYKLGIEIIRNVHLFDLTINCPQFIGLEDFQEAEGPAIDFDDENTFMWNVYENDYQDIPRHFTLDGSVRINEEEWELIDLEHKFIIPGACIDIEWMLKYMPFKKIELTLRKK